MKRLRSGLLALAIAACASSPEDVTPANFLSLSFEQQGGIAALHSTLEVRAGGSAEYVLEIGGVARRQSTQLTADEFADLIAVLNRNDFLQLEGVYSQAGADLILETIRLGTDRDVTEVRNQGEAAPRRYLNVRDTLQQLIAREFP